MKELRHIRRSRERWAARRARRAVWWAMQEPIDSYATRVFLDWHRTLLSGTLADPDYTPAKA